MDGLENLMNATWQLVTTIFDETTLVGTATVIGLGAIAAYASSKYENRKNSKQDYSLPSRE
jgi:hypothetical protein